MSIRRLLPVLLVLLQSGLAAGHAHHPGRSGSAAAPHFHARAVLDHLMPEDGDHDGDDHDADAVDLSGAMVSTPPPVPGTDALVLALAPLGPMPAADRVTDAPPAPLGLPPPTAGPSAPRYITFCTLTI